MPERVVHDGLAHRDLGIGFDHGERGERLPKHLEQLHRKLIALGEGLDILLRLALKVVEVDEGGVARVLRPQGHSACIVADLHLHHGPGPAQGRAEVETIVRVEAAELDARVAEEQDVGLVVVADTGTEEHVKGGAGLAIRTPALEPFGVAWVGLGLEGVECAVRHGVLPGTAGLDDDAAFIVVLKIVSLPTPSASDVILGPGLDSPPQEGQQ